MTAQSHDVAQASEMCQAVGNASPDVALLCWLPAGHGGDHWDKIDKVHWYTGPGVVIAPCEHKAVTS